MRIIDLHRRRFLWLTPVETGGLLLQEDFSDISLWSLSPEVAQSHEPLMVSFNRSPVPALYPGISGEDQIYGFSSTAHINTDDGGVREGQLFIDSDDTWYFYYGAGTGQIGWRPQVARSTDRGLTWEKLGDMGLKLNKYTSPGTTPNGEWAATDMLYMEKIGSTYYLHRMTADKVSNTIPGQPYNSEIFSSSSPIGGWSWVGKTAQRDINDTPRSLDSYAGSVIYYNGEYHLFSSDTSISDINTSDEYSIGRYTSPSLTGTWTRVAGNILPIDIKMQPENPKVIFHTGLNRWLMILNQVNKNLSPIKTDRNSIFVSTDPLNWDSATRIDFQFISSSDGSNAIGIPSYVMTPDRVFKEVNGYIPISFDTDSTESPFHSDRKLRWTTLEPSPNSIKFTPVSETFGTATRDLNNSDFTAEMVFILKTTSLSGFGFRKQDNGDGYILKVGKGTKLKLYKNIEGVDTLLADGVGTQTAWGDFANDRIKITAYGNVIKGYLNGELQINFTDTTNPFLSGESISFVAEGESEIRNLHLRSDEKITITNLSVGDNVVLRGVGGYPLAKKTATTTSMTIGASDGVHHFPAGEIEINGQVFFSGLIWGGNVFEVTTTYAQAPPEPAITDLAASGIFATGAELSFTPPIMDAAIGYYEVHIGNEIHNISRVGGSEYITGLTPETSYSDIRLVAVDVNGKRSGYSNAINLNTLSVAASSFPSEYLLSYYHSNDMGGTTITNVFGNNPITPKEIQYGKPGKVGTGWGFEGYTTTGKNTERTSHIVIPNPGITTKASISFWIRLNKHIPSIDPHTGIGLFNASDSASHYPYVDGKIYLSLLTSVRKTITSNVVPDRTKLHMFTITADEVANVWKFYLQDQLVMTSTVGTTLGINNNLILGRSYDYINNYYHLDGIIAHPHLHNDILSLTDVQTLFNQGKGLIL